MMGMTRPGTFTAAPTIQCHIHRKYPFLNTAADTAPQIQYVVSLILQLLLGLQTLQTDKYCIVSAVEQGGSLEGNEQ